MVYFCYTTLSFRYSLVPPIHSISMFLCLSLVTYSSFIHRSRFPFWYIDAIHFIHTECLNWLNRIRAIMVINQFFINISCTHRQLQPNPLYRILAFIIWFIFIVCPCIHTVIYFHFTQWHCLYIISLTIILDNSHLQFVDI